MNIHPVPTRTMNRPATAGPIIRAALKDAEFSATALLVFSFVTKSETKAWRAGLSKAATRPSPRANAYMRGSVMAPVRMRMPIAVASSSETPCVASRMWRRSNRSVAHPVRPTSRRGGPNWRAIVTPTAPASPGVSSVRTTQFWAVDCIQAPTFDTRAPMNQTR